MGNEDQIMMIRRHAIFIHSYLTSYLFDRDWGEQKKAAFLENCGVIFDLRIDVTSRNATFWSGFWIENGENEMKNPPGYKWKIS